MRFNIKSKRCLRGKAIGMRCCRRSAIGRRRHWLVSAPLDGGAAGGIANEMEVLPWQRCVEVEELS